MSDTSVWVSAATRTFLHQYRSDHDLSSVDAVIDHMRFRFGSVQTSSSCSSIEDADPKD